MGTQPEPQTVDFDRQPPTAASAATVFDQPLGLWFGALWPLAILLHLAANPAQLLALNGIGGLQLVMVGVAAAVLLRPRPDRWGGLTTASVGVLASLYLVVFWLKSPVVGNHEVLLALISLAVLISVICARSRWVVTMAPAGRWILLVAYGFIALSKWNSDFFDPVGSCAVLFADALGAGFGAGPGFTEGYGSLVIVATIVVESAIPVLLALRRTRAAGVVLALGFHFVLAIDPIGHVWDFSATLLPLFLLFLPRTFHRGLDQIVLRIAQRPLLQRGLVVGLAVALQGLALSGATPLPTWIVAYGLWTALGVATLALAVLHLISARAITAGGEADGMPGGAIDRDSEAEWGTGLWPVAPALLIVVGLTAAIGISPYLELRSAAAFNMYSNLAVHDGTTNHLLVGAIRSQPADVSWPGAASGAAANLSGSMVRIVEADRGSALGYYVENDLLVPQENLDRYLVARPAENVVLDYDGVALPARQVGIGVGRTSGWLESLSSHLRYKLGYRRAVDGSARGRCLRAWGPIG